jgi:hypothetical protein
VREQAYCQSPARARAQIGKTRSAFYQPSATQGMMATEAKGLGDRNLLFPIHLDTFSDRVARIQYKSLAGSQAAQDLNFVTVITA